MALFLPLLALSNHSTNTATIQQKFLTNVTQDSQQNCIATVNDQADDNVVIINGSTINGNVTGVQVTTSTDATCLMVANMENSIQNILSSSIKQSNKSETDLFNDFSSSKNVNDYNIGQSVVNNINQIIQQTCSSNTTQSSSDNYIYVTNSKINGDFVGVTSKAKSNASCSMTNLMKNTTYNQAQSTADQSNVTKGMFATLMSSIAGIIGIIVIASIIIFAVGAIGYIGFSKQKPSPYGQQSQLGLNPLDDTSSMDFNTNSQGGLNDLLGQGGLNNLLGQGGLNKELGSGGLNKELGSGGLNKELESGGLNRELGSLKGMKIPV